jgi:hypothetical protein
MWTWRPPLAPEGGTYAPTDEQSMHKILHEAIDTGNSVCMIHAGPSTDASDHMFKICRISEVNVAVVQYHRER